MYRNDSSNAATWEAAVILSITCLVGIFAPFLIAFSTFFAPFQNMFSAIFAPFQNTFSAVLAPFRNTVM